MLDEQSVRPGVYPRWNLSFFLYFQALYSLGECCQLISSTLCGTPEMGFSGNGGPAVPARLNKPYRIVVG
jgi:hypothetical protein